MKLNFYLADEVRSEQSGKQMLLGLYPDKVVIVNIPHNQGDNTPEGYILDKLSFLVSVGDAIGKHSASVQIISPSGKPLGEETALPDFELKEGKSHSLVIESKPFPFSETGNYKLIIILDKEPHEFIFEIRTEIIQPT